MLQLAAQVVGIQACQCRRLQDWIAFGLRAMTACTGGKAEGNPAMNTPRLRQQHDSYLQRQVANFRQGLRGSDPADSYGKQMKMMASSVNEAELLDVVTYISSLGQP